jgi:hypothetical protein
VDGVCQLWVATYGRDRVSYARQRNAPLAGALVERAQAAGQVQPDLRPTDIPFIIFTLAEPCARTHHGTADVSDKGI